MAFHETHERFCPHCNERMSATAAKCLNCGRYVDEDEDDEEPAGRSRFFLATGVVVALIAGAVVVFLLV